MSRIWERIRESWVIRTLGGLLRDALAPVAEFIGEALADALAFLADAIDAITRHVLDPIKRAWNRLAQPVIDFIREAVQAAADTYWGFFHILRRALPEVRDWLLARVGDVRDFILGVVEGVSRWARERIADLWDGLTGLGRWVRDNVLAPLGRAITELGRWARERIADLLRGIEALRRWVVDNVLIPLRDTLTGVVRFIEGRVRAVVELVEALRGVFEVLRAEGPAGLLLLLLPGRIGQLFGRMVNSSGRAGRDAAEAIDDWADVWLR